MKRILAFKHWQLFLLIIICGAWTSPSPLKEIINAVSIIIFTLWIFTIGIYGQQKVVELGLPTMNSSFFRINIFIIAITALLALIYSGVQGDSIETTDSFGPLEVLVLAVSFYLFFAVIHAVVFVSKTLATLEYRRQVSVNDYLSSILLIIFFFIGVWIIQPKVNRLLA